MTTDLSNKTVEELRKIVVDGWAVCGLERSIDAYRNGWPLDVFVVDELATRLKAAQEQTVAQQALIANARAELGGIFGSVRGKLFNDMDWRGHYEKRMNEFEDALFGNELDALSADRAEVAAEALEEVSRAFPWRSSDVRTYLENKAAEYRAKAKGDKP